MTKLEKVVLVVSILASFVAFLDSSVVNVALPAISKNLGGGLITQQWVVDAYLITLGSFILIAGSLSDLFGRKLILSIGLIGFGVTSILCAIAPNSLFLIIARGLQGLAGALLVPSSLALIISTFSGQAQGKAIGTWTAWTGISFIIGPLLGGFLVDAVSWRLIFAINILPIAACLLIIKSITKPEQNIKAKLDIPGAALCSFGLSGVVFALIEQPHYGWSSISILLPLILGLISLIIFIYSEQNNPNAMLPLSLFKVRNFLYGNIATLAIYGGLSIAVFLIIIYLQQVSGYTAFQAGVSLLPVTIIMFVLSEKFGSLAGKFGPRLFMTVGPIIGGLGFLYMTNMSSHVRYWTELFPGLLIFAVGLATTVAPLTAAVLGDVEKGRAGIASAVNNAIARIAGLITIATIGVIIGIHLDQASFHKAIKYTAALVILGGVISFIGIRNKKITS
ncbi:MAG TPA: MFS transporter [Patescibacteria group bacterium]|nr:MFS transporter [Patescibacteria group bacterium]